MQDVKNYKQPLHACILTNLHNYLLLSLGPIYMQSANMLGAPSLAGSDSKVNNSKLILTARRLRN